MNITFACPQCAEASRSDFDSATETLICPHCNQVIKIPEGALKQQRVTQCLVCPSTDLFVRKDFPQRLGVLIVAVGIIGSSIAWYQGNLLWTYGVLFATALIDVLLYLFVGEALMCYRCEAQYRGVEQIDTYQAFDLETHERYRQLAARMEKMQHTADNAG